MLLICSQQEFDFELSELLKHSKDSFAVVIKPSVPFASESLQSLLDLQTSKCLSQISDNLHESIGLRLYVKTLCEVAQNTIATWDWIDSHNSDAVEQVWDEDESYRHYMFFAYIGLQTPLSYAKWNEEKSYLNSDALCPALKEWSTYIPNIKSTLKLYNSKPNLYDRTLVDKRELKLLEGHTFGATLNSAPTLTFVNLLQLPFDDRVKSCNGAHVMVLFNLLEHYSIKLSESYIRVLMDIILKVESVANNVLESKGNLHNLTLAVKSKDATATPTSVQLGIMIDNKVYGVDGVALENYIDTFNVQ